MSAFLRALSASLVAALSALLALFLAWNHPLSPTLALLGCAALAVFTFMAPARWAYGIFPALPVAGLMTWTGGLAVEEMDLLVLAVAAGGHARLAMGHARQSGGLRRLPGSWRWMLPIVAVTLVALWRGLLDAGGDSFGWWQGYREPANSLRLAKGVFEALLLLPLMRAAWREDQALASARLVLAFTWMLLVTAAVVLWERLAFTSLFDFSSDYRATGLFWEMHVGGAALDAVLAVGMPFAAAAWAQARSLRAAAVPAVALALGGYACVVTFSRIVYIGVPLALALWWWLHAGGLQGLRRRPGAATVGGLWPGLAWVLGFGGLAAWLFPVAGWRGMLALLGATVLVLPLQAWRARMPGGRLALGLALGVLAAFGVGLGTWLLPKGAYLMYGAAWCAGVAAVALAGVWWPRSAAGSAAASAAASARASAPAAAQVVALAAAVAVLAAIPAVGWHWGGEEALLRTAVAALLLGILLAVAVLRPRPSWPQELRWQSGLLGGLTMAALLAGVFGGGAYMGERLGSLARDGEDRQLHWEKSLQLLQGPEDWLLGKGLGRYPAQLAMSGRPDDQTGDLRLAPADTGQLLVLTSGLHPMGSGALFRLSQRVPQPAAVPPGAPAVATLRLALRNPQPFSLVAEVCAKNLLYPWGCASAYRELPATAPGAWQTVSMPLKGPVPQTGRWWAPRPITFSLAIDSPGRRVEIDRVSLVDASGRELLGNGGFEYGLAYWYPSSDRHHLPWHAKNAAVHLLVEQGALGLAAWLAAAGVAMWRLTLGSARRRSLAPPLAAALLGLAAVGAVDSLFDLPRVAFLGSWLLVLALALPGGRRKARRGRSPRSAGRRAGPGARRAANPQAVAGA